MTATTDYFCDVCNPGCARNHRGHLENPADIAEFGWREEPDGRHTCDACAEEAGA